VPKKNVSERPISSTCPRSSDALDQTLEAAGTSSNGTVNFRCWMYWGQFLGLFDRNDQVVRSDASKYAIDPHAPAGGKFHNDQAHALAHR
jgi:hypothetical protein